MNCITDLHSFAVGSDGLDPNFELLREEYEHLVGGIVVVSHQNNEIVSGRLFLARFVSELLLELVKGLV